MKERFSSVTEFVPDDNVGLHNFQTPSGGSWPRDLVVLILLVALLIALRLPGALAPHEYNPDESLFLSQAMKLLIDPRPWIAEDTTTSGPVSPFFISLFLRMEFKPGFVFVHILATLVLCLQVAVAYFTLRRLGSGRTAALGGLLLVFLYGVTVQQEFLHFSGELLPTLFLMMGFYAFQVWLDQCRLGSSSSLPWALFGSALALGVVPWCKLQAAPIAAALGAVVATSIMVDKTAPRARSRRAVELIAFITGALITTLGMLALLAKTGALREMWYSYILGNLAYAGRFNVGSITANAQTIFMETPLFELFVVALLGMVIRDSRGEGLSQFKERKTATFALLAWMLVGMFVVSRPRFAFPHYGMLVLPPLTYFAAMFVYPGGPEATKPDRVVRNRLTVSVATVAILAGVIYFEYGAPYVSRLKDNPWYRPGKDDAIAQVVGEIQSGSSIRSMQIWGWEPGVFVLTGMPPSTRHSMGHFLITPGPVQEHFRATFLADLRANPPDLFVDAVAPGAFLWPEWTGNETYETFPELRQFVNDNYILVRELTLVPRARPVRFFERRDNLK